MTFEDFGLNPKCNAYKVEKAADIKNGVEYAKETIPDNDSVVFVVDVLGNTECVYKDGLGNVRVSDKFGTRAYWDSRAMEWKKTDYETIGAWMMNYMNELNVAKYGVIVENPDGSFQVLK